MHFIDKVLEHLFGHLEVGDHAILERTNGSNITWSSTQHALGVGTNCGHCFLTIMSSNGHNRGFI